MHGHFTAKSLRQQSPGMHARETEGSLRRVDTEPLDKPPDSPDGWPGIRSPVRSRPHLEPVDDEPVRAPRSSQRRGQHREVGKRGGVDDLVALPVANEVAENRCPEQQRRTDSPPALHMRLTAFCYADDLHSGQLGFVLFLPLDRRHIRDLMARLRKAHGQVAQPALGTSDRVRVKTVVDEADSQSRPRERLRFDRLG